MNNPYLVKEFRRQFLNRNGYTRTFGSAPGKPEKDELKDNPFFSKYAEKLYSLKQTDPEAYAAKLEALSQQSISTPPSKEAVAERSEEKGASAIKQTPQSLDKIMKVKLLRERNKKEIEEIWCEYHKKNDCVFACMSAKEYEDQKAKTQRFPLFVYPLPRKQGVEFFLAQWQDNQCFMTPLSFYQQHQENAPFVLTLTYYNELSSEKDIVLMNSQIDFNNLDVTEARLLTLQVKLYYCINDAKKLSLLTTFNENPDKFRYEDLIEELETLNMPNVSK
ncbi:DgyrCDS5122 [Dimorphilus gyrociliatus]|uniref:DgyrCDS5122 n=1 Tax=Dimorphilus gyrociliatus TaxID=2664684 RepID=A0A7I8VLJ9_9ANNE|nr:DgyrCDS5122 [Dimorphilus gyrociliatus]